MNLFEEIKQCYDMLGDNVSKKLFLARLSWNLSGDDEYIEGIADFLSLKLKRIGMSSSNDFHESFQFIADKINQENECIVVYGLGLYGKTFIDCFKNKQKILICDRNIKGGEYNGIPVISKEQLIKNYNHCNILITTLKYEDEIARELIDEGINNERILRLSEGSRITYVDDENQYFDGDIVKPIENEVFVDCGFFQGETTKRFIEWCEGKYDKIVAFEPNADNIEESKEMYDWNQFQNIDIINKGVWQDTRELHFMVTERGDSCYICDEGREIIQVTSVDDVLGGERATFIKMDVEGSELNALYGAQKTIEKYHPRLAICIYHKLEDIVEIQRYIYSLSNEYKFYIRQYSNYTNEMVLYAI